MALIINATDKTVPGWNTEDPRLARVIGWVHTRYTKHLKNFRDVKAALERDIDHPSIEVMAHAITEIWRALPGLAQAPYANNVGNYWKGLRARADQFRTAEAEARSALLGRQEIQSTLDEIYAKAVIESARRHDYVPPMSIGELLRQLKEIDPAVQKIPTDLYHWMTEYQRTWNEVEAAILEARGLVKTAYSVPDAQARSEEFVELVDKALGTLYDLGDFYVTHEDGENEGLGSLLETTINDALEAARERTAPRERNFGQLGFMRDIPQRSGKTLRSGGAAAAARRKRDKSDESRNLRREMAGRPGK